jgi:hypothetical protein
LPFRACETVVTETPAAFATSWMVGRDTTGPRLTGMEYAAQA